MLVFSTATLECLLGLGLVLGTLRSVNVVGIHLLMLLLLLLRHVLPILPFLRGQALPLLTDRFREVRLTLLFHGGVCGTLLLLAILAALAAEQDKRILWSLDIILISLSGPTLDVGRRRLSTFVLLHL